MTSLPAVTVMTGYTFNLVVLISVNEADNAVSEQMPLFPYWEIVEQLLFCLQLLSQTPHPSKSRCKILQSFQVNHNIHHLTNQIFFFDLIQLLCYKSIITSKSKNVCYLLSMIKLVNSWVYQIPLVHVI